MCSDGARGGSWLFAPAPEASQARPLSLAAQRDPRRSLGCAWCLLSSKHLCRWRTVEVGHDEHDVICRRILFKQMLSAQNRPWTDGIQRSAAPWHILKSMQPPHESCVRLAVKRHGVGTGRAILAPQHTAAAALGSPPVGPCVRPLRQLRGLETLVHRCPTDICSPEDA